MNEEKYLKVSEMGVGTETPEKTLKVTEVPTRRTPEEIREDEINNNLTVTLTGAGPTKSVVDAVRDVMYLNKAVNYLDNYDGWKNVAFYLAGRLDGEGKERF